MVDQDWDVFFCNVDDMPASILVNLALKLVSPIEEKTNLLNITITLKESEGEAFTSEKEEAVLFQIEDMLTTELLEKYDAVYAGRATSQGLRDFFFYMGDTFLHEKLISEIMINFPNYEYEYEITEEPDWETYNDFLFPDSIELQIIYNRRVVQHLKENNDDISTPRQIDHWIYFSDKEELNEFVEDMKLLDFSAVSVEDSDDEEYPYQLIISREDLIDEQRINRIVVDILLLLENYEAFYDGWETFVVE